MGSFVQDLWTSIFTPGTTPTLLVATNVTFAALQTLLFVLLIATYSIHFFILSFLSGALWWSINWFARELKEAQAQARAPAAEKEKQPDIVDTEKRLKSVSSMRPPGAIDTESETETETFAGESRAAQASATSATLHGPSENEGVRQRLSVGGYSSEHGSTDSEWEKVDDNNHA